MTSRKICDVERALQQHLLAIEPHVLADTLSIDSSGVSRIRSGERGLKVGEFIRVLSLKSSVFPDGVSLAPAGSMTVSRPELMALVALSKKCLNTLNIEECAL